ncbi:MULTISPECIES: membrane protein insertase YidC [Sorangium]|uniref:Membrane protein insertase YidC n=1 Tax=Sorangium cellulosum TaxID=56 RepID=A0A4P2QLW3_SORCE|nr:MULTISPECIES: membrane protein insertase YidC [Sorangium]AUX31057.1 insertase [Sorangium cellulosum]WCQ90438.1 Membrane protein insertase YidC [Sorangium sp. Soce836]
MERSNIAKWLFLGLAIILFIQFGKPLLFGESAEQLQPLDVNDSTAPAERAPAEACVIDGDRFKAELSTRGGSVRHVWMTDPKYTTGNGERRPMDLVTTSLESRMPLRTDLRLPSGNAQQVPFDDLDWKLSAQDGKSCTFTYSDDATRLTKVVAATGRPYELSLQVTVENLAQEPRKHRFALEQTAWRTQKETEGHLGLISEWITETVAATDQTTERQHPDAFEPGDFKDKEFTAERWRRTPGNARFVAVSSSYFSKIAIPLEGPGKPVAETQIEEIWDTSKFQQKAKDPSHGYVYRARLAYPEQELAPGGAVTYKALSFTGPKERDVLGAVGHGTSEVINLGWFSPIAKLLVSYLYVLYRAVGSWGWAIVLLTITVRLLLFPLSIQQIKSAAAMRKLKPEMDELNAKYKDDATQRGLAMQELWRKNKVANPVIGCFPMLLQMPVWFALYTALQTAVELYHTPFGPVIPDLSAPGKYFIIPIVLGASSFIQQKLMPPQGDPAQQKMMMYLMPGIFTAMMLFLPAGLGVYMLTNTWLGIGQQVLVERYLKAKNERAGGIEVREIANAEPQSAMKKTQGDDKSAPALGKGKARVRG